MKITLTKCVELNRLYLAWFASPPAACGADVWDHRDKCPICRENMRLCNLQADAQVYPEDEPALEPAEVQV